MSAPTMIDGPVGPLAIHELGGSGDETLIVCHATGFLGRVYRAFAAELVHRVRVIAIDFRAHGESAAPHDQAGFNWTCMSDDLEAVIAHVEAPTLHAFGHSMGGAALLETERRFPGTFRSAFVFEPIVPPGPVSKNGDPPLARAARGRLRSFPSRAEALQRYAARPPLGFFRADVLNDYVAHGFRETDDGVTLKCLPESEASIFAVAGHHIDLGLMPEIELDVVVGQSGDGELAAVLAAEVAEALPNGVLRSFPAITHFGPLQDPVTIAREMIGTIDSADAI